MKRFLTLLGIGLLLSVTVLAGPEADLPGPGSAYIQHLTVDPEDSDILYAAAMGAGLYRSTDGAEFWEEITPDTSVRAYYVVETDPENPRRIFTGGVKSGIWVSENRGQTWTQAGPAGLTVCDMAIDPSDPDRVFVLASDGVYRNENLGSSQWEQVFDHEKFIHSYFGEDLPNHSWRYTRFQKIAISPHDPSLILLGVRWEGGYHWSEDGGNTWRHKWLSGIFRRVDTILFHPTDPDIIYTGTHHQGMFATYNRGESWVSLSRGIAPERRTPFYGAYLISGLVMKPGEPRVMYSGSDHSNWKTINGGVTWKELDKTLTCEFARTMAVDPNRPETVYAGTNIGVYKSMNGGASWDAVNRGFPVTDIIKTYEISVDGDRYLYGITEGIPPLYRRPADGDSRWHPMSWMIRTAADSLSYQPASDSLTLYTPEGRYHSADGGYRWDRSRMADYAPVLSNPMQAPTPIGSPAENAWEIEVSLQGDAFFEDSLVDSLYMRPPYVSLQLVKPGYPLDGSAPVWSGNFERYLRGTVRIPPEAYETGEEYLLYAEVRDFQRNTLKGYANVAGGENDSVHIPISAETVLPAFQRMKDEG